jgi:hypothetical protein
MELKGEMGLDRIDPKVSTSEWKSGGSIGWIGLKRRWLWGNGVVKRQEVRPAPTRLDPGFDRQWVSTSEWKRGGSIGWIGSKRRWLWGNGVVKRQEVRPAPTRLGQRLSRKELVKCPIYINRRSKKSGEGNSEIFTA